MMRCVARTYQVSPKRLETWRGEWRARGEQQAFPGHAAQSQPKMDAQRIPELERKIGQQTMEIDFLKKVLRRFREQALPSVANGGAASTSKSRKRAKRRPA
jgi:transposase